MRILPLDANGKAFHVSHRHLSVSEKAQRFSNAKWCLLCLDVLRGTVTTWTYLTIWYENGLIRDVPSGYMDSALKVHSQICHIIATSRCAEVWAHSFVPKNTNK